MIVWAGVRQRSTTSCSCALTRNRPAFYCLQRCEIRPHQSNSKTHTHTHTQTPSIHGPRGRERNGRNTVRVHRFTPSRYPETCAMRETLAPTTQHTKAVHVRASGAHLRTPAPKVQPTKAAMKCARPTSLDPSRRRQRPRGGAACGVWAVGRWCRGGAEGAENDAAVAQQWCRAGAERGARSGAEGRTPCAGPDAHSMWVVDEQRARHRRTLQDGCEDVLALGQRVATPPIRA